MDEDKGKVSSIGTTGKGRGDGVKAGVSVHSNPGKGGGTLMGKSRKTKQAKPKISGRKGR